MTTTSARRLAVPVGWRWPITFGLVLLTAAGMVLNAVVATPVSGFVPIDYTTFAPAGVAILHGRWGDVFGDPIIQAGPFELIFWGIPALWGVEGLLGWIVFGIVVGSVFAIAFAYLVERLLRPVTSTWSVTLAVGAAAVAAMTGVITSSISTGHPAETAIPFLWIGSGVLARRGRPFAAAAVMAATTGWELWGILGVPILLLAPRIDMRTIWRSALGGLVVVALLFLPFALLGPFHMFEFRWAVRDNTLAHLLLPDQADFPWPLRLIQGVLSLGAGVATAVLTRGRRDAIWLIPLALCSVRLFLDPVLAGYYGAPPLLMLLLGMALAIAQREVMTFLLCLVAVNVIIDIGLNVVTSGLLILLSAAIVFVVARSARSAGIPIGATR